MTQLTITQARRSLLDLPERLRRIPGRAISIAQRGRPVLAVMPWEFYESIIETLEVLSDPEMTTALRNSLEDALARTEAPVSVTPVLRHRPWFR